MAFPPASSAATALRRFISLCDIAWKEGGAQGKANVARKSERRVVFPRKKESFGAPDPSMFLYGKLMNKRRWPHFPLHIRFDLCMIVG